MEASVANLWRPLGEILIEWQLLSEEQLERALDVQRRTGRRLGEVLIDLDLVPREVLVSVLLEQCGLEHAETQQGFGSGLLSELRKRGSAHRRVVPLQVVATNDGKTEEPPAEQQEVSRDVERRRRWGRRKEDRAVEKRADRVAVALASLETWAAELEREVAELRLLLADAKSS